MNIRIVTLHALQNPGSAWQAFALQEYLSARHNVEIIDYRPGYIESEGKVSSFLAKRVLHAFAYRSRRRKFESFVNSYMRLGKTFSNAKQLEEANLEADVFMAGSDQLWNMNYPCGRDPVFYLSFARGGRKVSYSTSVGDATSAGGTARGLRCPFRAGKIDGPAIGSIAPP